MTNMKYFATKEDIEEILQLRQKNWVFNPDEDKKEILARVIDFDNEAIVCLKNDNKIIWSSMIIFHPFQTFIYRFGIDPLYHGKWFWSLLCQYIEETLISKQMFHPTLFVEEENTIWIQFRSSHGRENLYKVECFVKNLEYLKDT